MFEDDNSEESPPEQASTPIERAREKSDEFRMHAELVAVFEGVRKFDAQILAKLERDVARDVQMAMAKLERAKVGETPLIPIESFRDAADVLDYPQTKHLSANDYHIHRRPGEVMIIRWLGGEQVDKFYERLQAHFDAAMNHYRAEERQQHEWRQDPTTIAYLDALDALEVKMEERYLRPVIRQHEIFVLSTQTADEMDILHLCDYLMGVGAAGVVGRASAPPEQPTERDRAWFFKLFSLRGMVQGIEKMCFFTFLQKAEDSFDLE